MKKTMSYLDAIRTLVGGTPAEDSDRMADAIRRLAFAWDWRDNADMYLAAARRQTEALKAIPDGEPERELSFEELFTPGRPDTADKNALIRDITRAIADCRPYDVDWVDAYIQRRGREA